MSGLRILFVLVLLIGLVGCATGDGEKLAALEQRIETLEKQMESVQANAPASQQLEQEAAQAYQQIARLVQQGKIDEAKTQLASFEKKYARTRLRGRAQSMSRELAVVGKDSPANWGIEKWFQGESEVKLAGDGTTLVVFWETWCPHCRREVPKLQAVYDKFRTKGLQVVGVTKITKSATEDGVTSFITDNKVGYPVAKEDGSLSQHFAVSGIPAAAVVKDGKVVWRGHPATLSDDMLNGWL